MNHIVYVVMGTISICSSVVKVIILTIGYYLYCIVIMVLIKNLMEKRAHKGLHARGRARLWIWLIWWKMNDRLFENLIDHH